MKKDMNELLFENLKKRCRMYRCDLISLDDVCGYMQALVDIGVIGMVDVKYILTCLLSDDGEKCEWMYE